MSEDYCVCCGEYVPEGRQVCYKCSSGYGGEHTSKYEEDSRERQIATDAYLTALFAKYGIIYEGSF